MKRLYFIRHGESEGNVNNIWCGRLETPLTPRGIKQAEEAAKEAKRAGLSFDLIVASPFSRTLDTAKILARELGYPLSGIQLDEILLERNHGSLEGTSIAQFFKTEKYENLDSMEGVETLESVQNRAAAALEKYRDVPAESVLFVSHAGFGRSLRRVISGEPYTAEYTKPFKQIPNAEIIQLI